MDRKSRSSSSQERAIADNFNGVIENYDALNPTMAANEHYLELDFTVSQNSPSARDSSIQTDNYFEYLDDSRLDRNSYTQLEVSIPTMTYNDYNVRGVVDTDEANEYLTFDNT